MLLFCYIILLMLKYIFKHLRGQGGLLGGNSMQGHDVHFDNENKRIGFAKSKCDYGSAVSKNKKL